MVTTLATAANTAIDQATLDGTYITDTSEPALVARLVANLPRRLVQAWTPHVQAGSLHVSSAFCHHKPSVHWVSALGKGQPELADLVLTVVSRAPATKRMTERVLLVQAKTADENGFFTLSQTTEHKQRYMYANWMPFTFRGVHPSSNAIPPTRRATGLNIASNPGPDLGTRYAGVSLSSNPTWNLENGAVIWSPTAKRGRTSVTQFEHCRAQRLNGSLPLGDALEAMYSRTLGREFVRRTDDWSTVVEYLFEHASQLSSLIHVKHARGAPVVPLAAASAFTHRIPFGQPQHWYRRSSYIPHLAPLLRDHLSEYEHSSEGRTRHLFPASEIPAPKRGFGVIRVVVNGVLSLDRTDFG